MIFIVFFNIVNAEFSIMHCNIHLCDGIWQKQQLVQCIIIFIMLYNTPNVTVDIMQYNIYFDI